MNNDTTQPTKALPEFSQLLLAFFRQHNDIKLIGFAKRAGVRRESIWRIMKGTEATKGTQKKILDAMTYYYREERNPG